MWGQKMQTRTEVFLVVSQSGDTEKDGGEGNIVKGGWYSITEVIMTQKEN